MRPPALTLLLAIALALLLARPAAAHANLVRSEPAAGALLDTSPPSLMLEFSEQLDPAFSQAQLFDSRNQLIEPGPGEVDPVAPRVLRLILPDLPKGSYTALYRVRSAADGHITQGSLPFGVGVAATTTSLIPPPGAPDPATLPPPPLDAVARWLNLVAAALALGGLPFGLLVWRPVFRRALGPGSETGEVSARSPAHPLTRSPLILADDTMTAFIRRTTMLGGLLFVLTNLLFLIAQAAAAANVPLAQAIGVPPSVGIPPALALLSGRSGLLWLARLALILQIVILARRLPPAGRGPARLWWALLAIGGVIVLTLSLLSHAAASPAAAIAVPLDWLHLAAMIAWLGGLIPLAWVISAAARAPDQTVPPALLIPRFSRLTIACVAILTLTGVYNYVLHIGTLDLLAATTYGRALLIKLGLSGVLLLLGGLNLFVLARRLRARTMDNGRQTMDDRRWMMGRPLEQRPISTAKDAKDAKVPASIAFSSPLRSLRLDYMTSALASIVRRRKASRTPDTLNEEPGLVRALGRSVRWELVAGALLLLAAGAMTSVAPSKVAWQAHEQQGIAQSARVGDVDLTLRIAPAQIGENEFAIDLADRRPGAQAAATRVLLRFDMLGMQMGQLQTEAQPAGGERYTARGSFTSMGGRWRIEVVLRRAGFDDVRYTFEIDIVRGAPFVIE